MAKREGFIPKIKINNAKIKMEKGWRGFGPEGDNFGKRGFQLIIEDPDMAQELIDLGWNVHVRPAQKEGASPEYRLPVAIKYGDYPPHVVMVTRKKGETELWDDTIGCLDRLDFAKLNVTITPGKYDPDQYGGKGTGVKAWLEEMKVWVEESDTMSDDEAPWDEEY